MKQASMDRVNLSKSAPDDSKYCRLVHECRTELSFQSPILSFSLADSSMILSRVSKQNSSYSHSRFPSFPQTEKITVIRENYNSLSKAMTLKLTDSDLNGSFFNTLKEVKINNNNKTVTRF
jgi:hypothetical protein